MRDPTSTEPSLSQLIILELQLGCSVLSDKLPQNQVFYRDGIEASSEARQ